MNKQEEKEFEKALLEKLKDRFSKGMIAGSTAMCSVILEKVNDKQRSDEEIIKDVKQFCETGLGKNK